MALSKDTPSVGVDDKTQMLKEALKCISGNLDFEKLAVRMDVANGEAMRKRFKRVFEKDAEPIQLKGSTLDGTGEGANVSKTPCTPRPKAAKSVASDDDTDFTHRAKSASKKRKATAVTEEEHESQGVDVVESRTPTVSDANTVTDGDANTADLEGPKKKAKTISTKPRSPVKAPQTPRAPKTPQTPRTPKSIPGMKHLREDIAHTATNKSNADDTQHHKNVVKTKTNHLPMGSPEVQAKTDAVIKKAEMGSGVIMGEPERQAKHDAIRMNEME